MMNSMEIVVVVCRALALTGQKNVRSEHSCHISSHAAGHGSDVGGMSSSSTHQDAMAAAVQVLNVQIIFIVMITMTCSDRSQLATAAMSS